MHGHEAFCCCLHTTPLPSVISAQSLSLSLSLSLPHSLTHSLTHSHPINTHEPPFSRAFALQRSPERSPSGDRTNRPVKLRGSWVLRFLVWWLGQWRPPSWARWKLNDFQGYQRCWRERVDGGRRCAREERRWWSGVWGVVNWCWVQFRCCSALESAGSVLPRCSNLPFWITPCPQFLFR